MRFAQRGDAFRAAHDAEHRDARGSSGLHLMHGLHGAAAGGEHRIEQENLRLGDDGRQIRIIRLRQRGLFVPLDAHMRHRGVRHERKDAIEQSKACAQDRHEDHGARKLDAIRLRDRRLHPDRLHGQIARGFEEKHAAE